MREIKFRRYDYIANKMENIKHIDFNTKTNEIFLTRNNMINGARTLPVCPIMQYTGLKDCNNKEIYESDIVKNVLDELKVVYFIDGVFVMTDFEKQDTWNCDSDLVAINHCEIVGNIYENKELLK